MLSGSVKQFADDLNAFIAEHAGVHDTHFMNPHGLFDKNHYTTSADMARITEYAMKNKTFRALFSEKQTALARTDMGHDAEKPSSNADG